MLNSATHWLQACGVLVKLKDQVMMNKPAAPLPTMGDEPLTLLQFIILFILWGSGLSFAIIAFIGEIWDVINVTYIHPAITLSNQFQTTKCTALVYRNCKLFCAFHM